MIKKVNFFDPFSLNLNVSGRLKSDHNKVLVHCIHHQDRHPSAIFNVLKGTLFCFSCHRVTHADEIARITSGYVSNNSLYYHTFMQNEIDYEIGDVIARITNNELAIGNSFLTKRGLTQETIEQFGILRDNESVYFPVSDYSGKTVGFVARRYGSMLNARYINFFEKERPELFDFKFLRTYDRNKRLFLVENFFGVPRGVQAGFQVLSTFGSTVKTKRMAMWLRDFHDIVAIFDRDKAGLNGYAKVKQCLPHAKLAYPETSADELLADDWMNLKLTDNYSDIRGFIKGVAQ